MCVTHPLHVVFLSKLVSDALVQSHQLLILRPQDDVLGAQLCDVTLRHLQEFFLVLNTL